MSKLSKTIASMIVILWWVIILKDTDAFYSAYILMGILGAVSILYNAEQNNTIQKRLLLNISSLIFPIIVVLSNYGLFTPVQNHILKLLFILASSYLISRNIIVALSSFFSKCGGWKKDKNRIKPRIAYFKIFVILILVYGAFLIVRVFPGVLTPDSLTQVFQALYQITSNHHPFYHNRLSESPARINTGFLRPDFSFSPTYFPTF